MRISDWSSDVCSSDLVPSLASRAEDVPALIRHFQRQMPADAKCRFDDAAMMLLMRHDWPGNARELRNFVERASVLHGGETLGAEATAILLTPTAAPAPWLAVAGEHADTSADDDGDGKSTRLTSSK